MNTCFSCKFYRWYHITICRYNNYNIAIVFICVFHNLGCEIHI